MIKHKIILISVISVILNISLNAQDLFNVKQLTFDKAQNGFPTWSPDSRSIVYQYTDLRDTTGKNGLWRINSDGTGAEQIFGGVAEHARWSPKGQYIVFDADTGNSIKMIPADGGISVPFAVTQQNHNESPAWSPDGNKVAFTSTRAGSFNIWIMDVDIPEIQKKTRIIKY